MSTDLTFEGRKDAPVFSVSTPTGLTLVVEFIDAPDNFYLGQNTQAISYYAADAIRGVIYKDLGKIFVTFLRDDTFPRGFRISLSGADNITSTGQSININNELDILVVDGSASLAGNVATLMMTGPQMLLEISGSSVEFSVLSQSSYRASVMKNQRVPEFVIEVADDSAFVHMRPTRFSVPVVSTVPVFYDSATDKTEGLLFEEGRGLDFRKIFFRATPDVQLDSSIDVYLRLWLPAGVDTLAPPLNIKMALSGSRYTASYIFHKEDTVNYVDGYAYMGIHVPLTVEGYLPLGLDITSDGSGGSNGEGEWNVYSSQVF